MRARLAIAIGALFWSAQGCSSCVEDESSAPVPVAEPAPPRPSPNGFRSAPIGMPNMPRLRAVIIDSGVEPAAPAAGDETAAP